MKDLEKFNELKSEITKSVEPFFLIKVSDFESSKDAIEAAKQIKAIGKKCEDKRKELTKPLNDRVKEINEYVKDIKAPLDKAEAHVRNQLNEFAVKKEEERQAALKEAEAEQKKKEDELKKKQEAELKDFEQAASVFGTDEDKAAFEEKQQIERDLLKMKHTQKKWDIDQQQIKNTRRKAVVKVIDLEKVPREYLLISVNEKAALAVMKAGVKIPGLEMEYEVNVAVGEKTRVTKAALGKD